MPYMKMRREKLIADILYGILKDTLDGGELAPKVLDIGTGNQLIAEELQKKGLSPIVTTDVKDYRKHRQMRTPKEGLYFLIARGEALPFSDNSVSWVTLIFVLHHAKDPSKLIKEALRVAKKGVIIIENDVSGWRVLPTLLIDLMEPLLKGLSPPYHVLSENGWKKILQQNIEGTKSTVKVVNRFRMQWFWKNIVFEIKKLQNS